MANSTLSVSLEQASKHSSMTRLKRGISVVGQRYVADNISKQVGSFFWLAPLTLIRRCPVVGDTHAEGHRAVLSCLGPWACHADGPPWGWVSGVGTCCTVTDYS